MPLAQLRRWFGEHDFQRRPDVPFEQVAADGRAVAPPGNDMHMDLGTTVRFQRDIANEGQYLHLLVNWNLQILLLFAIEIAEDSATESADTGDLCGGNTVFL